MVGILIPVAPITVRAAPRVALRHQIVPGSTVVYKVRIETARGTGAGEQTEIQTGKLTRVIFSESKPGQSTCAQMLELDWPVPASAPAGTQPERNVPAPDAASSPAWVQFSLKRVGLEHAPLLVPGRTAWTRHVLSAVVDVTDFPREKVTVGDGWDRPFQAGSIKGRHRCKVEAFETTDAHIRVTLTVTTEVDPPPERASRHLVSARSVVVFSVRDRELLSLDGRAVWREADRAGGREVTTRITLSADQRDRMPPGQQATERQAIRQLAQAVTAYQREDYEYASRMLQTFMKRWPQSRWRPVAEYISRRMRSEGTSPEPLTARELKQALARQLTLWNLAEQDGDAAMLNRCRSALSHLAQSSRPEITRLLNDADPGVRALACFALGFGSAPADVALLLKACQDADARVRRSALEALAIRASPLADADTLLKGISDDDPTVRQRACEAVGACLPDDSPHRSAARAQLVDRLADDSPEVVLATARALMRIGSAGEIEKIKQTAESAGPSPLQDALREILSTGSEK